MATIVKEAFCHVCRQIFLATEIDEEKQKIIAEDAQDESDYFTMDAHNDGKTGLLCKGSGKSPESMVYKDEGWPDDDLGPVDHREDGPPDDDIGPVDQHRGNSESDERTLHGDNAWR